LEVSLGDMYTGRTVEVGFLPFPLRPPPFYSDVVDASTPELSLLITISYIMPQ
jgi:hypothetical protein